MIKRVSRRSDVKKGFVADVLHLFLWFDKNKQKRHFEQTLLVCMCWEKKYNNLDIVV